MTDHTVNNVLMKLDILESYIKEKKTLKALLTIKHIQDIIRGG